MNDYFDAFCLDDNKSVAKWELMHYKHIGKNAINLDISDLKAFLQKCEIIATSGWGTMFDNNSNFQSWNFEDIRKEIDLKSGDLNIEKTELVAKAIRSRFNYKEYKKFIELTSQYDGFGEVKCRKSILDKAIGETYSQERISHDWYHHNADNDDKEFWFIHNDLFLDHLKLLLDWFQRTDLKVNIFSFLVILGSKVLFGLHFIHISFQSFDRFDSAFQVSLY